MALMTTLLTVLSILYSAQILILLIAKPQKSTSNHNRKTDDEGGMTTMQQRSFLVMIEFFPVVKIVPANRAVTKGNRCESN